MPSGHMHGFVELFQLSMAYRFGHEQLREDSESGRAADGASTVASRASAAPVLLRRMHIDEHVCHTLPSTSEPDKEMLAANAVAQSAEMTALMAADGLDEIVSARALVTPIFSSKPDAPDVIFNDVDGYTYAGGAWGTVAPLGPFDSDNNSTFFSTQDITRLTTFLRYMGEDFALYNIDVTTNAARFAAVTDANRAINVVSSNFPSYVCFVFLQLFRPAIGESCRAAFACIRAVQQHRYS